MTDDPKQPVDRLIEGLRAEGTAEPEAATFTLQREKAKVQLARFTLPDPEEYVLQLVQAAVLHGARELAIDIDADDMRLSFDGPVFQLRDFERLYDAILTDSQTEAHQARRALAIGLHTALTLDPRFIRVRSGDGERAVQLELRPGKPDALEPVVWSGQGTEIHVKRRLRPGLLRDAMQNMRGALPMELLLRRRCSLAEVRITLEGELISKGLALPEVKEVVRFKSPLGHGLLGYVTDSRATRITLVRAGIALELPSTKVPDWARGLQVQVASTALHLDVSQAAVVQDEVYDQLMQELQEAAHEALVTTLNNEYLLPRMLKPGCWLAAELHGATTRVNSAEDLVTKTGGSLGWWLGQAPIWPTATRDHIRLTQALIPEGKGWQLCYTTKPNRSRLRKALPELAALFPELDDRQKQAFGRIEGLRLREVTPLRNAPERVPWTEKHSDALIRVDIAGDGDYRNLESALNALSGPGVILLSAGLYRLPETLPTEVAILGLGPRERVQVDINRHPMPVGTGRPQATHARQGLILSGLTLTADRSGYADLRTELGDLTIEDCSISGLTLTLTGYKRITLRGCRIHNVQSVSLRGTAVRLVDDCVLSTIDSGLLLYDGGPVTVRDCFFVRCRRPDVRHLEGASLHLERCHFIHSGKP